jgi:hypothetical protein
MVLGIFEVMLIGGIWGTYLLIKNNRWFGGKK